MELSVEACKQEYKRYTMLDLVSVEDEVRNMVEVLEYPYAKEQTEEVLIKEIPIKEMPEETETVEDESVVIPVEEETQVADALDLDACEADFESNRDESMNYEKYKGMTCEERAELLGLDMMIDFGKVHELVSLFFYDIDYEASGNEIMEEAELVYRGMRNNFITKCAKEIVVAIKEMDTPYLCLTNKEKAELFRFSPNDNNYNLELHTAVLRECGVKLAFDDVYEDYQGIYDKTMEMQEGKTNERSESKERRAQ